LVTIDGPLRIAIAMPGHAGSNKEGLVALAEGSRNQAGIG
jgi:hypothetical protein